MSKNINIPKPLSDKGYTIKETASILKISESHTNFLFKKYNIEKNGKMYYASLENILSMIERENQTLKEYHLI